MTNREPTSRKEFEMDVNGLCRGFYIIYTDTNKPMRPEDHKALERDGKLLTHIVNRLLARHHHPPWAHPEKNPNYDEWHNYREMKWLDTVYKILEKRYIK